MGYYELMREKTKDEGKRQGTGFEGWERISREGESLLPSISSSSPLPALISMSTGDFHTAASQLSALTADTDTTDNALLLQNLALCLFYTNQLPKTRDILKDLVSRS